MTAPDDTRARILAEASQLFRESGLGGFSMRRLAARLELSATALYRHFDDKERLLVGVCAEGFERFAKALWQALEAATSLERLRRTGQQYLAFALDHENFYRIMFMTQVELLGWKNIPEENLRRAGATFQFLQDRVTECLRHGELRPGDVNELSAGIWSNCHGLVALWLDGHFGDMDAAGFQAFYLRSCDTYLRGLGAPIDP